VTTLVFETRGRGSEVMVEDDTIVLRSPNKYNQTANQCWNMSFGDLDNDNRTEQRGYDLWITNVPDPADG
jgi:hypothetical protein